MESGEPDYNKALKKSYILVISRENLYTNQDNANNFEKTITPTVREEEHIDMNPNFMHWKLYEVNKFSKMLEDNLPSNLKEEWLQFFAKCHTMNSIPEGVSDIIKKAYKIMITDELSVEKFENYAEETIEEYLDRLESEEKIKKARVEAEAEAMLKIEQATIKAKIEAEVGVMMKIEQAKTELKAQIKIEDLKKSIDLGVDHNLLLKIFDNFNEEQISAVEHYVHEHPDCSTEKLMSLLAEEPIQALEHAA